MGQDFYKLFNVGIDDKSISSLDPAGIALKAIQELANSNTKLDKQVGEQQKIIDAQQKQINALIEQNKLMLGEIEKLKN